MKILQVNVRLTEGGAAQVAWTLQQELENMGHEISFLYGYGSRGGFSLKHNKAKHIKFTSRISAAFNLVFFRLTGNESSLFKKIKTKKLISIFKQFDIIHLHVVHSYFVNYKILINSLAKSGVPIVWTLHDQWIITGRCAQPGNCTQWLTGCKPCVNKSAYPPSIVDNAAKVYLNKQNTLRNLFSTANIQLVSCAKWLTQELEKTNLKNIITVTNSIDHDFFNGLLNVKSAPTHDNLFICRDLRDEKKIDWPLLERVSKLPDQTLTIVGNNPLYKNLHANYLSAINNRYELAKIYKSHKRLIFTSMVDYYPLTITEALASGLDVFALLSPAALEFTDHPNCFIFNTVEELYSALSIRQNQKMVNKLAYPATKFDFSPAIMSQKYEAIYKQLLEKS